MKPAPTVAVIGTLDTKSTEIGYVRDRLRALGAQTLVIDSGILGTPTLNADIDRATVARASGVDLERIQNAGSRGAAVELMQRGLRRLVQDLYHDGRIQALLCLGGAEGGLMGAAAMQALPIGVPKLIVSPSASGRREFGPFVGSSDVLVMHSVVDILGLNSVARSVFDNAVGAIMGMCQWAGHKPENSRPCIGITMLGQTTPGAMVVASALEQAGYEPIIFHANGVGGPAMEGLVHDGAMAGVIDFTLSEVANSLFDGLHATDETRMTAAVLAGLPLLVVPGASDFFNQGARNTLPEKYADRMLYHHNPVATLVRLRPDEMAQLGKTIAQRLVGATAPTRVLAPTMGFSLIGIPGGPIADMPGDLALIDTLEANLPPNIPLERVSAAINDASFGQKVAGEFVSMLALVPGQRPTPTGALNI